MIHVESTSWQEFERVGHRITGTVVKLPEVPLRRRARIVADRRPNVAYVECW